MGDAHPAGRTLVLGIGNLLMGDEGAGVRAARRLQEGPAQAGVDVVDGGTGGFHLLEYFGAYERLILVDATMDGAEPGTVRVIEPKFAKEFPPSLSAHDIGLKDMLEAALLLGHHPRITLVTISVSRIDRPDIRLSPAVEAALPRVVTLVRQLARETPG